MLAPNLKSPRRVGRPPAQAGLSLAVNLAPVPRETVQDRVYRELRRALIHGRFNPGEVLTIQGLATTLATSTMPVREALSRLISERALEALPNRSVRVPLVDAVRLEDLLRARIVIEGAALEMAAPRLESGDFARLRSFIAAHDAERRSDPAAIERQLEANQGFHFLIYAASGSTVFIPIIESLWLQSGPYIRAAAMAFNPRAEISASHYHGEIVAALEKRNVMGARAALARDISRAFALLRAPAEGASAAPRRRAGAR
jgi:DNA-binding GntR family transcriptional regulator